ncbi:MAG: hypothetical protein ACKVW3_10250 [Phycisphaerales bacterium]
MPRELNVTKLLHAAHEAKLINIDTPLRAVVSEAFVGAAAIGDEPWDIICADWISVIRKGPRGGGIREIETLAGSLRGALLEVKNIAHELQSH